MTTKLVPLVPTEEMISAAIATFGGIVGTPENLAKPEYVERMTNNQRKAVVSHYESMLAAAPADPSGEAKLPERNYTPAELCFVALHTLIPVDIEKRNALSDLIKELERPDGAQHPKREQSLNAACASSDGAAPTSQREPGWMPIETAPRDGSHILMWSRGRMDEAWWRLDVFGKVWQWGGDGWSYPKDRQPTYWRERPTPPSAIEGNKS